MLVNECYLKFTASPYFFELDLFEEINVRESKCTVKHEKIEWVVEKKVAGIVWAEAASLTGVPFAEKLERRQKGHSSLLSMQEKARILHADP